MKVRKITLCFCSEDILPIERASKKNLILMWENRLDSVELLRSIEGL